jgi:hypothetical protein
MSKRRVPRARVARSEFKFHALPAGSKREHALIQGRGTDGTTVNAVLSADESARVLPDGLTVKCSEGSTGLKFVTFGVQISLKPHPSKGYSRTARIVRFICEKYGLTLRESGREGGLPQEDREGYRIYYVYGEISTEAESALRTSPHVATLSQYQRGLPSSGVNAYARAVHPWRKKKSRSKESKGAAGSPQPYDRTTTDMST